jgi:hypothetical protein
MHISSKCFPGIDVVRYKYRARTADGAPTEISFSLKITFLSIRPELERTTNPMNFSFLGASKYVASLKLFYFFFS